MAAAEPPRQSWPRRVVGAVGSGLEWLFGAASLTLGLAFLAGLHVRIAAALILSYRAIPAGTLPGAALIESWSLAQVSHAFGLSFSLAAPFVIAALLYNVALGFINRAMPGLMVAMIGAPALAAGVLILLAVAAPLMLAGWQSGYERLLADPFAVVR